MGGAMVDVSVAIGAAIAHRWTRSAQSWDSDLVLLERAVLSAWPTNLLDATSIMASKAWETSEPSPCPATEASPWPLLAPARGSEAQTASRLFSLNLKETKDTLQLMDDMKLFTMDRVVPVMMPALFPRVQDGRPLSGGGHPHMWIFGGCYQDFSFVVERRSGPIKNVHFDDGSPGGLGEGGMGAGDREGETQEGRRQQWYSFSGRRGHRQTHQPQHITSAIDNIT